MMGGNPEPGQPVPGIDELLNVDRVIHEPARLALVAVLAACESADFRYLQRATNLTHGNLAAHMNKLEEAGYVTSEKRFVDKKPNTLYRLTLAGRTALEHYRKQVSRWMK